MMIFRQCGHLYRAEVWETSAGKKFQSCGFLGRRLQAHKLDFIKPYTARSRFSSAEAIFRLFIRKAFGSSSEVNCLNFLSAKIRASRRSCVNRSTFAKSKSVLQVSQSVRLFPWGHWDVQKPRFIRSIKSPFPEYDRASVPWRSFRVVRPIPVIPMPS